MDARTRTDFLNRPQYRLATDLAQVIGKLVHALLLKRHTRRIRFQNRRSRRIVLVIDRAGCVAMEMAAISRQK
jgi:hypothetical protein